MKIISWNVNGIRAVIKKDFVGKVAEMNPDVLCLQETKAQDDQVTEALEDLEGYHIYSNSAVRKGYSGVAILTKKKPLGVSRGMGIAEHDDEGRLLTAEYPDCFVISVYVPNSGNGLVRLDYRTEGWDKAFRNYVRELEKKKPVIICGDLNVAHQRIDIARPDANYNKTAGYTQREIDGMTTFLQGGLKDTFRTMYPDQVKYSWWSYRGGAREKNIGWRLDYVLVSDEIFNRVQSVFILNEIDGSDHCPVGVVLESLSP
jgi:exodeoxyribonuclease III